MSQGSNEVKKLNPVNSIVCCNIAHDYNRINLEYLKTLFGESFRLLELHSNNPSLNNDISFN